MANFKHGAYAEICGTQDEIAIKSLGTVPIYFGTSPVGFVQESITNKPLLIESFEDAVRLIGYSENWNKYTLCEAVFAHFRNSIMPIGPIVVVNSVDLIKHKSPEKKTKDIFFVNKRASFDGEDIILSTIEIADKIVGVDYSVTLENDFRTITLTDLKGGLSDKVVSFETLDTSLVTTNDIVFGIRAALPLVYQKYNIIASILVAPGFSHEIEVNDELLASADKINGHWYAFVNCDIEADETADTVDKAITIKALKAITSPKQTITWPLFKKGDRIFHGSTMVTVGMQQIDYTHDGIPFETPSNKKGDYTSLCLRNGKMIEFDNLKANKLNQNGIMTGTFWRGEWLVWGGFTAAYVDGVPLDPKDVFHTSVRTLFYLANTFQLRYALFVDKPMTRALVDTILNDFNAYLDRLVAAGAILMGKITFNETSNYKSDMILGDFVFDLKTTTTPPAKSLTVKISYTSSGLDVLFG